LRINKKPKAKQEKKPRGIKPKRKSLAITKAELKERAAKNKTFWEVQRRKFYRDRDDAAASISVSRVKGITNEDLGVIDHLFRVGLRHHIKCLNDFINDVSGEYEKFWVDEIKPGKVSEKFVVEKFIKEHKAGIKQIEKAQQKYFPEGSHALPDSDGDDTVVMELIQIALEISDDVGSCDRYKKLSKRSLKKGKALYDDLEKEFREK